MPQNVFPNCKLYYRKLVHAGLGPPWCMVPDTSWLHAVNINRIENVSSTTLKTVIVFLEVWSCISQAITHFYQIKRSVDGYCLHILRILNVLVR